MSPFSLPIAALTIAILALIIGAYQFWKLRSLNKLRKSFFAGQSGVDLESILHTLQNELKDIREGQMVLDRDLSALSQQLNLAVQKVGMVRFNPFEDGGGNFSFSLALLNWHNSGVVLTSMHGRQQNRIYTKKIEAGKSETALTEEEQRAIAMANSKP